MTADPLTRRVLDEMEQERTARAEAEAEERRTTERLAALSPEERAEFDQRLRKEKAKKTAEPFYVAGGLITMFGLAIWTVMYWKNVFQAGAFTFDEMLGLTSSADYYLLIVAVGLVVGVAGVLIEDRKAKP